MLDYIYIGSNDLTVSTRFYKALLCPMGYEYITEHSLPAFRHPDKAFSPSLYLSVPFNGLPATEGNGMMLAFDVASSQMVDKLHQTALLNGGTNEGAPGFRSRYGNDFYVSYVRDPYGNKLAIFARIPA
ncbi:hypothetical protein BTJ39_19240 [Izhakiella australiensis]|uniref:Glyoxalase n=1 Tax=Izhakiella australiensis TaxID=1926881 RepID=A0A1S8YG92_9GAMM|nr:VOC family protein [Izhakiella australiensis]OON38100.1 hypothetical protein BTJ39_19240 [Izhakiella australiensis]